jgi:hypothetical protein
MPTPPSATWTTPDIELFQAGDRLREDEFLAHVLQNLQFLGTAHNHDGGGGDGGTLATADPKAPAFYTVGGSPFP